MTRKRITYYRQLDQMDCGPTCLRIIAKFYGKHYTLQKLREDCFITRHGVSLKGISEAATRIGFKTFGARITLEQLFKEAQHPCILHWNQNHFVVLPPQKGVNLNNKSSKITIADPAHGEVKVELNEFIRAWQGEERKFGNVLILELMPSFYDIEDQKDSERSISFFLKYLRPHRAYLIQLILGMILASVLSLLAPFLTQSLVDFGINYQDTDFIKIILLGQLFLFFGNTAIEIIRGWLLLHVSARMNISIISDFLIKLMNLPIKYFDTKMVGDITQRITDHRRIEQFLTGTSLSTLFSFVNIFAFSIVLAIYSVPIFFIFLIGSIISICWIMFFLKKRRELDYTRFQRQSDNQNSLFEIITGMQEIKLNNSEVSHRWGWERIQAKLFKLNVRTLSLAQYQSIGFNFITQLKNILILYISANEVLNNEISLGMMLSITFITGQLNSPITQLLTFFQTAQDAKISIERLNEIHGRDNEEKVSDFAPDEESFFAEEESRSENNKILFENVSFRYGGHDSSLILDNINLEIPFGTTTAIVGASGSGKTTLMKLLLKFYEPTSGNIYLSQTPLESVSAEWWRRQCGVVLTDGFIFSNTIRYNIAVQEEVDNQKLMQAAKIACIDDFIKRLPLGYYTKIGNTGNGISSGQKQRFLIARAVYKNPKFLFLDEATSTLDANNEKTIINNLEHFYSGRTVFVIAHRLSTVRNADQIIVLDSGKIVEQGNHKSLIGLKGKYYELVKNQLDLD